MLQQLSSLLCVRKVPSLAGVKERINNSTTEGKKESEKATKLEFIARLGTDTAMQQHVAMRKHKELQQVGWDRTERAKGIPGT